VDALNPVFSSVDGVLFDKGQTTLILHPMCKASTSYTVSNSVTRIAGVAFIYCYSLSSVTIPSSVTNIGSNAFTGCTNLTAISVDALNAFYCSVDGDLYDKGQTTLIQCPGAKAGADAIPNSVTSIGDNAFSYCAFLSSVTIASSVTNIAPFAFYYCSRLTGVYFQGNAPAADSYSFRNANAATAFYLPGTTGWSNFSATTGRPTKLWNPLMQASDPSFGVRTNRFGFTITGTTNIPIVVEACTNLASASWTSLQSCILTNGSVYFSDAAWTNNLARFYRVRSP
jgi:hypothetical protein